MAASYMPWHSPESRWLQNDIEQNKPEKRVELEEKVMTIGQFDPGAGIQSSFQYMDIILTWDKDGDEVVFVGRDRKSGTSQCLRSWITRWTNSATVLEIGDILVVEQYDKCEMRQPRGENRF